MSTLIHRHLRALLVAAGVLFVTAGAPAHAAREVDEAELACLAEAIYFEARSESVFGQTAVGEVILNRRDNPDFPDTICEVVRQGYIPGTRSCQFSYYCDGKPERIGNRDHHELIRQLARHLMLEPEPERVLTDGATYFHATYVSPNWAKHMRRIRRVETHVFYKPREN